MPNPALSTALDVPLIDLAKQNEPLADELAQALKAVLSSGAYVLGPHVQAFEEELAAYLEVKHVLGVTSGTDALLLAMMALDIGPGDEVITTPFTWFSTVSSIVRLGAKPVFVDINPQTYCIEARDLEGVITPQTKAVLPVHLYGMPANMAMIQQVAEAHGLKVIEDAAQAIGATHDGKKTGTLGDVGCFSFYPTKNLSALGDAGAVVTDDEALAEKMTCLRNHGMVFDGPTGYDFPQIGGNFRMSGFQGAALSVKLKHLDAWTASRRAHAERYHEALETTPVTTPFVPHSRGHVFHQYTIRVRSDARNALMHHLSACHVQSKVFYAHPLHLQPCFESLGYKPGMLPEAERTAQEVLSLPIMPEMTDTQQQVVVDAIQDFFRAE